MAKTIIDMKGIVKKFYIGQPNELTILKGIDLTVEEGEFLSIVGSVRFGQIHPDEHHRCAGPPDRRGISAGDIAIDQAATGSCQASATKRLALFSRPSI